MPTHDTFEITRRYDRPVDAVFRAFADPERKHRWYAVSPAHEVLSYAVDFRTDGVERLEARMLPGTPVPGALLCWTTTYARIVQDRDIVFFQTLDVNGARVSAAVATIAIVPDAGGALLTLTHQAVFFEGADGPDMRRMGWEHLLAALAGVVESA